jgi:hypothetical protein
VGTRPLFVVALSTHGIYLRLGRRGCCELCKADRRHIAGPLLHRPSIEQRSLLARLCDYLTRNIPSTTGLAHFRSFLSLPTSWHLSSLTVYLEHLPSIALLLYLRDVFHSPLDEAYRGACTFLKVRCRRCGQKRSSQDAQTVKIRYADNTYST